MKKLIAIFLLVSLSSINILCSQKLHRSDISSYWLLENGTTKDSILSKDTLIFSRVRVKGNFFNETDSTTKRPHLKMGNVRISNFPTGGFSGKFKKYFWFMFKEEGEIYSYIDGKWYLRGKKNRNLILKKVAIFEDPYFDIESDETTKYTGIKLIKYKIEKLTQDEMMLIHIKTKGVKKSLVLRKK